MKNYINDLQLIKHPEGGYYKEVKRSSIELDKDLPIGFSGKRNLYTSILFLLPSNEYSAWHRIKSEETWFYHDGGCLNIFMLDDFGKMHTITLGKDITKGEVLQFTVPANTIFASKCKNAETFSLVSCTVYPGFDFEDFELFTDKLLMKELKIEELNDDIKKLTKQ